VGQRLAASRSRRRACGLARRPPSPLRQVDDRAALAILPACVPDAQTLEKILVSNPARLYGFEFVQPTRYTP
jgi:hypothetical protein